MSNTLPLSAFNFILEPWEHCDGLPSFSLFIKDGVEHEGIAEDDIRDEHVPELKTFCKSQGLLVENTMENCWEVYFDTKVHTITSCQHGLDTLRQVLAKSDATWDEKAETDIRNDVDDPEETHEFEPEWEDGLFNIPDDPFWTKVYDAI